MPLSLTEPARRWLATALIALTLAACATMPAGSGFTRDQTRELQAQGFVETAQGWELSVADRLLFATDSADVLSAMQEAIARGAGGLLSVGISAARVEGHTDDSGTAAYNARLSERRASAVAAILSGHGFAAGDLVIVGRGESLPIADNASPEGRAQNRRVVIIVTAR